MSLSDGYTMILAGNCLLLVRTLVTHTRTGKLAVAHMAHGVAVRRLLTIGAMLGLALTAFGLVIVYSAYR